MSLAPDDTEYLIRSTVKFFTKGLRRLVEAAEAKLKEDCKGLDLRISDLDDDRGSPEVARARTEEARHSPVERGIRREDRTASFSPSNSQMGMRARSQHGLQHNRVRVIRFADEVGAQLDCTKDAKVLGAAEASSFLTEPEVIPRALPQGCDFLNPSPLAFSPSSEEFATSAFTLGVGRLSYAVLPPARPDQGGPPDEDFKNRVIAVPPGWEVLSTAMEDFEGVITKLTTHKWGTPLLIVQHRNGFNTYRTPLSKTGVPGSKYKENTAHLLPVGQGSRGGGGKQFRFAFSNGRLIICTGQPDTAACISTASTASKSVSMKRLSEESF